MTIRDQTAWLKGGSARCPHPPPAGKRVWRIVLLGAPGVGRGSQAQLLTRALGACALSTGELLRETRTRPSRLGPALASARMHLTRGELVPDLVMLALLRERQTCLTCRGGFLLDGFPRTWGQAKALEAWLSQIEARLDAVIEYELPETALVARVVARRVCHRCQATFHLQNKPPRVAGVCDECGSELVQTADDYPSVVAPRLRAYAAATQPLLDYYRQAGLLVTVSAAGTPPEVFSRTLDALAAREPPAREPPPAS